MSLTRVDPSDVRIARVLFLVLSPAALIGAGLMLLILCGLIIGPSGERNPWNGQEPESSLEGKLSAICMLVFLVLGLCQWIWYGRLAFVPEDCLRVKLGWLCSVILNIIGISGSAFLIWNSIQESNLLWEFLLGPLIICTIVLIISSVPFARGCNPRN